jgi:hypothetical protein
MGSGPVWNQQILPKINNCQKYWWQNLIYVQNLINPQNMVIKIFEKKPSQLFTIIHNYSQLFKSIF